MTSRRTPTKLDPDRFIAKRKSRWPCDACVIHARFARDEILNLAARRFARNNYSFQSRWIVALGIFTSPLSRLGKYLATIHLDFKEHDQWLLLKPELLWLLTVNALQINELGALRNTFYPEYKYLYIYLYIYLVHFWKTLACRHTQRILQCYRTPH